MPQTVNSAQLSYASGTDLILYHDVRVIGDYCRDDDTREPQNTVPTNVNVMRALSRASSEVEMACTIGQRYDPTDLAALAASTTIGRESLVGLCCDLAFCYLAERRVPNVKALPAWERSQNLLKMLREGERIFPFLETQEAGSQVTVVDMTTGSDNKRHDVTDVCRRFFGTRAEDLTGPGPNRGTCGGWW